MSMLSNLTLSGSPELNGDVDTIYFGFSNKTILELQDNGTIIYYPEPGNEAIQVIVHDEKMLVKALRAVVKAYIGIDQLKIKLTEDFGEPCTDYHPTCINCRVWAAYKDIEIAYEWSEDK